MGTSNAQSTLRTVAVVICGKTATGKSEAIRAAAPLPESTIVSFGSYMRHLAKVKRLSSDRYALQELGDQTIKQAGYEKFLEDVLAYSSIGKERPGLYLFDGVRHLGIWEAILRRFEHSVLIGFECTRPVRLSRLQSRDALDARQAESILNHQMDVTVDELLCQADLLIRSDKLSIAVTGELLRSLCNLFAAYTVATAAQAGEICSS